MAILNIVRMGHPVLRQVARTLDKPEIGSRAIQELIDDMIDTLHHAGGIGLAAPQVNHSIQLAIVEINDTQGRYGELPLQPMEVYINPVITIVAPDQAGFWEGCLSIPGLRGFVERPQHIRIDYLNRQGLAQSVALEGFLATVFQHEFDHLQGRLYIDHIKDMSLLSFEEEFVQFHLD
jgi:peptide deformylase